MCTAMNPPNRRRCSHCRRSFLPDCRNAYHQRFCSTPACQHASKRNSQRRWLRKPENRNYFREPDNLERVRAWRNLHPGYWRPVKHSCQQLQAPGLAGTGTPEGTGAPSGAAGTLQDFCRARLPAMVELVSTLGRCALQEDIARFAAQVVMEAQCIVLRCQSNKPAPGQPCGVEVNFHETG